MRPRGWFASLPIHRKLIVMALTVSAAALLAAVAGLVVFDAVRFQDTAADDAKGLAQVIAENASAAIVFGDADAARQMLASTAVRPTVSEACAYRADGSLLAGYQRGRGTACPAAPAEERGWRRVASLAPVMRNGRTVGSIYVVRTLTDLPARVMVTAGGGLFMLALAVALAFALAHRLQQVISRPIVALADAARAIGRGQRMTLPDIAVAPDETGDLVRAFADMVQRLVSSNDALRAEVEERRRMQAEREGLLARERDASRLKDEFLAAVSHELRTPLNAILGWTQVLSSTKPTEQTIGKAIASLSRNAQAQNRVIEDLLDVSRIITGKLRLALTAVDLRNVLEASIEIITPIAAAKNIRLEVRVPAVACVVQGDFDRLRQVLWNLLSNAVKFTPAEGSVSVSIVEGDDTFAVVVSDTGAGISPAFLPHVFERFRQADGSMTREHGGLGLGLAIVKELTELHGGVASVASAGAGKGATFKITLPRLVGTVADSVRDDELLAIHSRLDGLTVLAVDDNPDGLDVIVSALGNVGARVETAGSAIEALDKMRRNAPDVVLCDLAMPGMDGFAALKSIRELDHERGRTTPVVAVTAYVSEEYLDRCRRAGFQGHIAKPFSVAKLVREIAAVIGDQRDAPPE